MTEPRLEPQTGARYDPNKVDHETRTCRTIDAPSATDYQSAQWNTYCRGAKPLIRGCPTCIARLLKDGAVPGQGDLLRVSGNKGAPMNPITSRRPSDEWRATRLGGSRIVAATMTLPSSFRYLGAAFADRVSDVGNMTCETRFGRNFDFWIVV
jgi:hypothetical protein